MQPAADLHADPQRPRRDAGSPRTPVEVAVGILSDAQGRYLLTSRPAGKDYAGYWEFPGGKLEPGEDVARALARELQEELGLQVQPAQVHDWRQLVVDYPHALVRLHFCRLGPDAWRGTPRMREGQSSAWIRLPTTLAPILPGALPVLQWLQQEDESVGEG